MELRSSDAGITTCWAPKGQRKAADCLVLRRHSLSLRKNLRQLSPNLHIANGLEQLCLGAVASPGGTLTRLERQERSASSVATVCRKVSWRAASPCRHLRHERGRPGRAAHHAPFSYSRAPSPRPSSPCPRSRTASTAAVADLGTSATPADIHCLRPWRRPKAAALPTASLRKARAPSFSVGLRALLHHLAHPDPAARSPALLHLGGHLLHVRLKEPQAVLHVLHGLASVLGARLELPLEDKDLVRAFSALHQDCLHFLEVFYPQLPLRVLLSVVRVELEGTAYGVELVPGLAGFRLLDEGFGPIEIGFLGLVEEQEEPRVAPHVMVLEDVLFKLHHLPLHDRAVDAAHEALGRLITRHEVKVRTHGGEGIDNDTGDDCREDEDHCQVVQVVEDEPPPRELRAVPDGSRAEAIV
mmetsp:Transcript_46356/g.105097  ORF Transcript_46356/g.105097 Transcript_46356/m.105097 type:complete len:414 (-) Transcript_46356:1535-2776(-)